MFEVIVLYAGKFYNFAVPVLKDYFVCIIITANRGMYFRVIFVIKFIVQHAVYRIYQFVFSTILYIDFTLVIFVHFSIKIC